MSTLNDSQRQEILDAIKSGQKIAAIKLYREHTGLGLKEAKEFIEELTDQLRKENPEVIQSSKAGCSTAMIAFSLLVGMMLHWLQS